MRLKPDKDLIVKKETNETEALEDSQPAQEIDPVHKAIATDEYAGKGGSYLYDPTTGKRTPITE